MTTNLQRTVKEEIAQQFNTEPDNITFAKVSTNGLWNFDVKKEKFEADIYFVFYKEESADYTVAKVPTGAINVATFPEKDPETIRFYVDAHYQDRSGFNIGGFLQ